MSESAALIIDGGFAAKTGGAAIVPYGTIEILAGTLVSTPDSGITTRESGAFKSNGGQTYMSQFRTSVNGASAVGTYEQNGGTVVVGTFSGVTGPSGTNYSSANPSGTYYTFSLTYNSNVFIMTDGVLDVNEPSDNDQGSIFINSDPGNINVTGGTVNVTSTNDGEAKITSRAPFYNLNILNTTTVTTRKVVVGTGTSAGVTITTPDLVVLNDLTIKTGTTRNDGTNTFGSYLDLCPNNTCSNLEIGRNLTIEDNAVLDIWAWDGSDNDGSASVTFNGSLSGVLYVGDITSYTNALVQYQSPDAGPWPSGFGSGDETYGIYTLPFYNWIIDKPGSTLSLAAKLPSKGNGSPGTTASAYKTSNGGKNLSRYAVRLVQVTNDFQLINGTLSQIDPYSTLQLTESGGSSYGTVGDPVAYGIYLQGSITNNGTCFTYTDGTRKEGTVNIRTTNDVTINSTTGASFGNLEVNLEGYELTLTSDLTLGRLQYASGIIDIGTHNLKVGEFEFLELSSSSFIDNVAGQGVYNVNDYIRMAGNASDGGLSIKMPRSLTPYGNNPPSFSDATYTRAYNIVSVAEYYLDGVVYNYPDRVWFPIGTAKNTERYTPALMHIVDESGVTYSGDEYVTVRVVDSELKTADISGGDALSYYWSVTTEGFDGGLPTVSWIFQYDDSDVVGTEANYVPGKVENGGTYQRSYDGTDQAVKEGGATGNNGNLLGTDPANVIMFNGNNWDDADPIVITDIAGDELDAGRGDAIYTYHAATVDNNWSAVWPGSGFALENANYTAGVQARFVGAPEIFYNKDAGSAPSTGTPWTTVSMWTNNPNHTTGTASRAPQAGDIVELANPNGGGNTRHYIRCDEGCEAAEVIFDNSSGGWGPRLLINLNVTSDFGSVSGTGGQVGVFLDTNPANSPTLNGDFGKFNSGSSNQFIFFPQQGTGVHDVPSNLTDFPNVRLHGSGGGNFRQVRFTEDVNINGDLRIDVTSQLTLNSGTNGDINISGQLQVGPDSNGGRVSFPASGTGRIFKTNDISINPGTSSNYIRVETGGATNTIHTLEVTGDVYIGNGTDDYIDLYTNNTGGANVKLVLSGEGDGDFWYTDNTSGSDQLYMIEMNKGNSTENKFYLFSDFFLPTPATIGVQPVEILNGLLVIQNAGIDITLTDATRGNFYLPNTQNSEASSGSGGLEINQGIVRILGDDTGMILDGPLVLSGGDFDLRDESSNGNNYIEYSSSGNASISITDANSSMQVGRQIRRSTLTTSGVLDLTITAGELEIGGGRSGINSRAMLEIANPGSSIIHTGGTIRFLRQNGTNATNASIASLFLEPATSDISGTSLIEIDLRNGDPRFAINSNVALNNVNLLSGGTDNGNEVVQLRTRPLTINGDLNVSDDIELRSNNLSLTLNGNGSFVDDAFYTPGINTTTFSSSTTATLNAASTVALSFFSFTKSGNGILNLSGGNIAITGASFDLVGGTLADNDNLINFSGQVMTNNASHTSLTGGTSKGIIFNSTDQQTLSTDSEGFFGNLTINNPSGVALPDFNQQFTIDSTLTLSQGIFDIGPALLIIEENGKIVNSSGEGDSFDDFGENAQIQTNSSIIDFGLQKTFAAGTSETFFFPVGEATRYTPILLEFNAASSTTGSIRVRPRNSIAPIMESEVSAIKDKVLQYHWIINTDGFGNDFNADLTFNYDEDVLGSDEANYLGSIAFFGDPDLKIADGVGSIDIANNTFTIPMVLPIDSLSDPLSFSGEYFAGDPSDIPDEFTAVIFDNNSGDNSMKNILNYFQDLDDNGVRNPDNSEDLAGSFSSDIFGSAVEIGDNLTMTIDDQVTFSRLIIPTTATVEVDYSNPDVFNLQLGQVSGNGTISIISDGSDAAIPPGDYNTFFSACGSGGGALQYGGTGSYPILAETNRVRQLTLTGSGSKSFPSNLVTICEDLIITGGTTTLADGTVSSPIRVTILDDLLMQSGTLQFGENAVLDISDNAEFSGGTTIGTSGSVLEIAGDLIQSGGAVIAMTGVNRGTFKLDGSTAQSITGNFDGSNSIGNLTINNTSSTGVTIANGVGNRVRVNNKLTLTDGVLYSDVPALANPIVPQELLILSSSATVSGASNASHVDGAIRKESIATNASFAFPVGDNGYYAPASINSPSVLTNWTVMYRNTTAPRIANISGDFDDEVSDKEYWVMDGAASGVTANVSVTYGTQSGVTNATGLVLALLKDLVAGSGFNNDTWSRLEANNSGSNNSFGTVSTVNPISFSTDIVTLGEQAPTALPVELINFTVKLDVNARAILNWQTASEIDNDYFEIQKSVDGTDYLAIGQIDGNGNSADLISYQFIDRSPYIGLSYYRLKQVDFDGAFEFSPVISVKNDGNYANNQSLKAMVVPNPSSQSELTFVLKSQYAGTPIQYRIVDIQGNVAGSQVVATESNEETVSVKIDRELSPGLYFIFITQGNQTISKKVIIK